MKEPIAEPMSFRSSLDHIVNDSAADSSTLRLGVTVAVLAHIVLFVANWPSIARSAPKAPEKQLPIVILRHFEYKIPPTPPPEMPVRRPPRAIPVPDPDPLEPEPIRNEVAWYPEDFDSNLVHTDGLGVPDPPPEIVEPEVLRVGVDVTPPRRIVMVEPIYPELARRARMEGIVVLSLIVGTSGRVESIEVLRGLYLGMTEAAVEAARQWVFEPSVYNGRPIAIEYVLTVRFTLS